MAENAVHNGTHAPHDSAMSVEAPDDALRIKQLESEVKDLAERANNACMSRARLPALRLHRSGLCHVARRSD